MKNLCIAVLLVAATAIPTFADHHHTPVALVGVWNAEASSDQGAREITWTFSKKEGKITGVSFDKENGDERQLDRVKVDGKSVVLEIDIEQDGRSGTIRVEAEEKSPGKLSGEWSIVGDDGTKYMDGEVTAIKQVAFAGSWDAKSTMPNGGELEFVMELKGENKKLEGVFEGDNGETDIDSIYAKDNSLLLEFDLDYDGNQIDCEIKAKPEGDNKLVGKWKVIGEDGSTSAEGDWVAVRKAKSFAGKWDVVAAIPNGGEYDGTLTLVDNAGKYSGTAKGDDRDANQLESCTVDGENVEFSCQFEQGEYAGTITVEAKLQADGSLKGEWALTGKDGQEMARDAWHATRE